MSTRDASGASKGEHVRRSRKLINGKSIARAHIHARRLRFEALECRKLLAAAGWTAGPNLPAAVTAAAPLEYNGNAYLFGGSSGTSSKSTVYDIAPGASSWSTAAALDQGRAGAGIGMPGYYGATSDGSSTVISFGGVNGSQTLGSTSWYNLEGATSASMLTPRAYFAYVTDPTLESNQSAYYLYAIGGTSASGAALSSVERYDAANNVWTYMASLPIALTHTTAASDGAGHIFVFGGRNSSGTAVSSVYSYNVATNSWSSFGSMPAALSDASAVYVAYGEMYVVGGKDASGHAVTTVEEFDPVLNTWTASTPLPSAVYDTSTLFDANGNINVIGGTNSTGAAVKSVWLMAAAPAPTGLPAYPTLQFPTSTYVYNYFVYNGAQEEATAFAYASDGVTPVDGNFTYTYNGSLTPPTNAGTYQVIAHFTSNDPNYVNADIAGQLVIEQAFPTINVAGTGTFAYDSNPHTLTASQVGIDGVTPVSGSFSYTYNGSSTLPVAPGTYTAVATFNSSDTNYNSWTNPAPGLSSTNTITILDPTIPTGVTITPVSTSSLTISWNAAWEANASLTPASSYNVYERLWHPGTHSPRGSGGTPGYYYYVAVATGVTGTSYTVTGLVAQSSHTYAVTSVSPSGVESAKSALVSGQPKYVPSFAYSLVGGALSSLETIEVGQTLSNVTMQFYGNEPPVITKTSGPANLSINPSTGIVTYTPAPGDVGNVTATFLATNSLGTATASFSFHVIARPTVVVTGGTFTFDGNTHSATAVAYGSDGVTPVAGTFAFTYSPVQYPTAASTAPYAESGDYIVNATFNSSDPNYGGATGTGEVDIVAANPMIVISGGPFPYDGNPHAATATAYDVFNNPLAGTFTYTYDGSSTQPTAPGTYTVVAGFTLAPNPYTTIVDYNNSSATGALVIQLAGPMSVESGMIQGGLQGPGGITKIGPDTATLTGTNSYTGGTVVSEGKLIVDGPAALPDGSSLVVGSEAAFGGTVTAPPPPLPLTLTLTTAATASTASNAVAGPLAPMAVASASSASAASNAVAPSDASANDQALLAYLATSSSSAGVATLPSSSAAASDSASDDGTNRDRDVAILADLPLESS